jgi:hypothetical protein
MVGVDAWRSFLSLYVSQCTAQGSGELLYKKTILGGALLAALTLGALGLTTLDGSANNGPHATQTVPEARNPDRIQAPPRPARVKPIERVVATAPK